MAGLAPETLTAAIGPYEVDKDTVESVIPKIRFRHYKPDEIEIAKRFLRSLKLNGTYYFNVVLLSDAARKIAGEMVPESLSDIYPWCYEIDALVRRPGHDFILEFKERLVHEGLGQLVFYKTLYWKQYPHAENVHMVLVVQQDNVDMRAAAADLDIRVEVV